MKYALTLTALVLLFACHKTEPSKASLHLARSDKQLLTLLPITQQFGVRELDQTALSPQQVRYSFTGQVSGTFTYKQVSDQEMELTLQVEGNSLQLYGNKKKKTLLYNGRNLLDDKVSLSLTEQTEVALALTLYREVTDSELLRTATVPIGALEELATCKYTAMSLRISRSAAQDHLNRFVDNYLAGHSGCSRLHGVDSGCLWEDYACIATQQLSCNC